MTTQHTPGPWTYEPENNMVQAPSDWTDEDGNRHHDLRYPRVIAHLPDDWDARKHGALLAAAPELLAALREAQEALDVLAGDIEDTFPARAEAAADLAMRARAAIAKAEGRA